MSEPARRDSNTESGELRAERDRFAAFALAAADLLVEVNGDGPVVYMVWAASALTGRDVRQLIGSAFDGLFAEPQRAFARTLLRKVRRKQRMKPVKIDLERGEGAVTSVVLNGCCLPEKPNAIYFTASRALAAEASDAAQRDAESGLLDGSAFQAAATAALNDPARGDLRLTLLDVGGIDELRSSAGEGAVSRPLGETVDRISQVRSSISKERLSIVFQPVVALGDRRLHHYEVLSRFDGERSPAELVQFAEGVGMIEELDLTVCQSVLAFMDAWQEGSELRLAVNLSGRSLGSDAFIAALQALLKPRSDQDQLLFEITETTEIADLPRDQRVIQDLRRSGHKVCLDDFGAGAASFPYLQALTIDFVKIDGAYIGRMLDTVRDHAILKAMVGLCGDLKVATIAEMIETQAQAER